MSVDALLVVMATMVFLIQLEAPSNYLRVKTDEKRDSNRISPAGNKNFRETFFSWFRVKRQAKVRSKRQQMCTRVGTACSFTNQCEPGGAVYCYCHPVSYNKNIA